MTSSLTLQTCVEEHASDSDKKITQECCEETSIVTVPQATAKSFGCQIQEGQISECVYDLCDIRRRIVVLRKIVRTAKKYGLREIVTSSHQLIVDVTGPW
jgi:hypothetical protein